MPLSGDDACPGLPSARQGGHPTLCALAAGPGPAHLTLSVHTGAAHAGCTLHRCGSEPYNPAPKSRSQIGSQGGRTWLPEKPRTPLHSRERSAGKLTPTLTASGTGAHGACSTPGHTQAHTRSHTQVYTHEVTHRGTRGLQHACPHTGTHVKSHTGAHGACSTPAHM